MEFPPVEQLGYGINMLGATPFKIDAITDAIIVTRRLIEFDEFDTRPYEVDGVVYAVPKLIGVSPDDNTISSTFTTYKTGSEASTSFRNDPSLSALHTAVTGNSVNAATQKAFRNTNQWAFYCYYKNRYLAQLRNFVDNLQKDRLITEIKKLPLPFNGSNKNTVAEYKQFFDRYGTHIITKVRRGSRLQLQSWADNSDKNVANNWQSYIKAYYGGIPSGGDFDASVTKQADYQKFKDIVQYSNAAQGGDPQTAGKLVQNPSEYSVFEKWADSLDEHTSQLTGLVVTELWSLMRDSDSDYLNGAASRIETAFNFITNNPSVHKTAVTFTIESDWAEFGLITPSAVIIPGSTTPNLTVVSETKVNFGKEKSHVYYREIVNFFIVNDGYPIDFYISHGSQAGSGWGSARVVFGEMVYENKEILDDDFNTKWYYQKPVSPTPESFELKHRSSGANAWDATLEAYLRSTREGLCVGNGESDV